MRDQTVITESSDQTRTITGVRKLGIHFVHIENHFYKALLFELLVEHLSNLSVIPTLTAPRNYVNSNNASPALCLAETGQSSIFRIEQAASYFYETTLFITALLQCNAAETASTLHTEIHTTNTKH